MISTRTAERLCRRGHELSSIADALHEHGLKDLAEALEDAARRVSAAGLGLERSIMALRAAMRRDAES